MGTQYKVLEDSRGEKLHWRAVERKRQVAGDRWVRRDAAHYTLGFSQRQQEYTDLEDRERRPTVKQRVLRGTTKAGS